MENRETKRHARFANALQRAESHARRQFGHKNALQLVRRLLEAAEEAHIVASERRRAHVERERDAAVGAETELHDLGQRRVECGRVLRERERREEKRVRVSAGKAEDNWGREWPGEYKTDAFPNPARATTTSKTKSSPPRHFEKNNPFTKRKRRQSRASPRLNTLVHV